MKTTYLVWKDPFCNGVNPDWQEIRGQEFLALVRSPEHKGRRFIRLSGAGGGSGDGDIVMEATKEQYEAWKKEKNHADYLRRCNRGFSIVSYHALESNDGIGGEELLEDKDADVEAEYLRVADREILHEALSELASDEYRLIACLYLTNRKHTEQEVADILGISQQLLNYRKKAILKKIRKKFGD